MTLELVELGFGSIKPHRHRLVALASLCCLLTLYPSPSPLFHLLFLPILILAEKSDKRLCVILTFTLSAILTLTRPSGIRDSAVDGLITAPPLVVVIVTTMVSHRKICNLFQCQAWTRAMSFGILWSASSVLIAHTAPEGRLNTLTPSAARFEFLRPILRGSGEGGIDILMAVSGYTIALWCQYFLYLLYLDLDSDSGTESISNSEADSDETISGGDEGDGWEWFKMFRLGKGTSSFSGANWLYGDPTLSSLYPSSSPSSPPCSLSASPRPLCDIGSSAPTRPESAPLGSSGRVTYGSLEVSSRPIGDLIDLESSRSRPLPFTTSTHDFYTASELITPCPSISLGTETDVEPLGESEVERESILKPSTSLYDVPYLPTRHAAPRNQGLGSLSVICLIVWMILLATPSPSSLSLSAPLSDQTPLSVACVLPPRPLTLERLVYHSQMVAGRSKLLVWPQTDLGLVSEDDWRKMTDWVHRGVTAQYGVWVIVNHASGGEHPVRRVLMVGPEGEMNDTSDVEEGESHLTRQWTMDLSPPTGVTRFNWTHDFPHLRSIHVASLDLADATLPKTVSLSPHLPSIMIITSQPCVSHEAREIGVARDQAIKHGTPTVFCASSTSTNDTGAADGSTSALIDPWGNTLFQQMGGETWSLNTAIEYEYHTNLGRSMTGYEFLGDLGAILLITALLAVVVLASHAPKTFGSGMKRARRAIMYSDNLSSRLTEAWERYSNGSSRDFKSYLAESGYGNVDVEATDDTTDISDTTRSGSD